jgi:pimeloyl-ACP methyl ester carboxylesterase/DNA-binding SARP family transcriptional activator
MNTHHPSLELMLHGYPQVQRDGRVLPLRLKAGLALLAYLSLQQGQKVGRDALAALLWPDARAGLGRARLRRLVHETQGVLGAGLIEGDVDALWLSARVASDLARTRAAIAALDGGDAETAEFGARALLRADACSEWGHAGLIRSRALQGDEAAMEAAYFEAARQWRSELGQRPSQRIEAAYAAGRQALLQHASPVEIGYAPTAQGDVAYASLGQGSEAIVVMWGLMTNIEVGLDEPRVRAVLERLARRHRVVMIDRRGMGLSERVGVAADAAAAAEDVLAVLDRLGLRRAWLFGSSVGGTMALDIAARRPDRVSGLLLFGTSASGRWTPETPWALKPEGLEAWLARLSDPAHYDEGLRRFAPSAADDPQVRAWYARLLRNAASRRGVAALLRAFHALDLRPRLHAVRVPTLVLQRAGDRVVPAAAGEQLARAIPGARLERLAGDDHFLWHGDAAAVVDAIERFVALHRHASCDEALAA